MEKLQKLSGSGVAIVNVLRPGLEFAWSTPRRALAARTQVSVGLDALNATVNRDDTPDGRFVSWLTQLEYAHRMDLLGLELAARAELQLASDPLLSLERYALGGAKDGARLSREPARA